MRKISLLVMLLSLFMHQAVRAGDREIRSNLDVATALTRAAAESLLLRLPGEARSAGVLLEAREDDEKYRFIRDVFASVFSEGGVKVYAGGSPGGVAADSTGANPAATPYALEIQALEFGMSYPKIYRSHLIGGKRVKRSARVKFSATLLDPSDGSVVWVREAGGSFEDHFPYRFLDRVEEDLFSFTKPERPGTNWGRIVEPVVVSGIIVGLIYLFFANQSGD